MSTERRFEEVPRGRLVGWAILVVVLIVLNYAGNVSDDPPDDFVYLWESAIAGAFQFAIMLAIVLALARGPWFRDVLGLRAPRSWRRALGLTAVVLVAIYVVAGIVAQFLDPGEEQGLVPEEWDAGRLGPFLANFVVIALFAPLVEEVAFRGLGFGLLRRYGVLAAVVLSSLAWALGHGLVEALAVFVPFGLGLAWLRLRTASLYPCILLHSVFNGIALVVAVATAG